MNRESAGRSNPNESRQVGDANASGLNPFALSHVTEFDDSERVRKLHIQGTAYATLLPPVIILTGLGVLGLVVWMVSTTETAIVGAILATIGGLSFIGFGYGFAGLQWRIPRFYWISIPVLVISSAVWVAVMTDSNVSVDQVLKVGGWALGAIATCVLVLSLAGWYAFIRFRYVDRTEVESHRKDTLPKG